MTVFGNLGLHCMFFYLDHFLRVTVNQEPQPKHVCALFFFFCMKVLCLTMQEKT